MKTAEIVIKAARAKALEGEWVCMENGGLYQLTAFRHRLARFYAKFVRHEQERLNVGEKDAGEPGIQLLALGHKFFKLTEMNSDNYLRSGWFIFGL